jgi:hypothetical protein
MTSTYLTQSKSLYGDAPDLADQIGPPTAPQLSPVDILTAEDEADGLRRAYEMTVTYRELLQEALAALTRLTEQHVRLKDRYRESLDERARLQGLSR